ncbi:MAG: site-specific DNA-methyltransferase [Spirochaetales bacterium]|nr:site-specific DNA-methyltransferase [Spirochaetales bacterium]
MNTQGIADTTHEIAIGDAQSLDRIPDESVDLVVTSPPYPMIEMWDTLFTAQHPEIKNLMEHGLGKKAFLLMHKLLDPVWLEIKRTLKPGGFVCINIGDATRTVGNSFQLYPNHTIIQKRFFELQFDALPIILWWKPTNAPNKFMGSGMLAAGAYVTLEHEYILIFRKGAKREFSNREQKLGRRQSALFWEERNTWYSDRWDLNGVRQILPRTKVRKRSAAYPFELAYRLINMFSVQGDLVVDPFLGTGTTLFAAMTACRNSMGVELERGFIPLIKSQAKEVIPKMNDYICNRINAHKQFVHEHILQNKKLPYKNRHYGFAVKTRQETDLFIPYINRIHLSGPLCFNVSYYNKATKANPHIIYKLQ